MTAIRRSVFRSRTSWLGALALFIAGSALASVYRGERAKVTLELTGETFDALRHEQGVEVKAVTHHGLVVDPAAHRVEVLLDV